MTLNYSLKKKSLCNYKWHYNQSSLSKSTFYFWSSQSQVSILTVANYWKHLVQWQCSYSLNSAMCLLILSPYNYNVLLPEGKGLVSLVHLQQCLAHCAPQCIAKWENSGLLESDLIHYSNQNICENAYLLFIKKLYMIYNDKYIIT